MDDKQHEHTKYIFFFSHIPCLLTDSHFMHLYQIHHKCSTLKIYYPQWNLTSPQWFLTMPILGHARKSHCWFYCFPICPLCCHFPRSLPWSAGVTTISLLCHSSPSEIMGTRYLLISSWLSIKTCDWNFSHSHTKKASTAVVKLTHLVVTSKERRSI